MSNAEAAPSAAVARLRVGLWKNMDLVGSGENLHLEDHPTDCQWLVTGVSSPTYK